MIFYWIMEFYISPQSGQFYMINVLENQWLSVTYKLQATNSFARPDVSKDWSQGLHAVRCLIGC